MKKLLSELIFKKDASKEEDFKIFLRNETSRTIYSKPETIFLRVLKEDGLIVEMPINICQKGHSLTLFFLSSESRLKMPIPNIGHVKEASFSAMAKVDNIEVNLVNPAFAFIDLHFTQYDMQVWKSIIESIVKDQESINEALMNQHKR
ncbi:MAG: hypothetical protein ACXVLQ_09845 [Bacteriovorax sp.]